MFGWCDILYDFLMPKALKKGKQKEKSELCEMLSYFQLHSLSY